MGLNTFLHSLVDRLGADADLHAQIDTEVPADKAEEKAAADAATDKGEEETTSAA